MKELKFTSINCLTPNNAGSKERPASAFLLVMKLTLSLRDTSTVLWWIQQPLAPALFIMGILEVTWFKPCGSKSHGTNKSDIEVSKYMWVNVKTAAYSFQYGLEVATNTPCEDLDSNTFGFVGRTICHSHSALLLLCENCHRYFFF